MAAAVDSMNSTYSLGWWNDGRLATSDISSVSKQVRHYLKGQHVAAKSTKRNTFLFARSGSATVGIYIGKGLQSEGVSSFALNALSDNVRTLNISSGNIAMQLCDPNSNNAHTFGIFASSNRSFTLVQSAMKTWSNGGCLSFENEKNITGPAVLTTPLLKISSNATQSKTIRSSSTVAAVPTSSSHSNIVVRAECSTVQVEGGDSCSALATKCGISAADFSKYNSGPNLCSSLMPGQHVCCSAGTLPNFAPKPNPDGSCATYTIQQDDNCANLAAQYSLTKEDLEDFNKKTWGWNGCSNVWVGTVFCLSSGSPPMPDPVANAVCGPQVPGTEAPEDTMDIAGLNPCPLNACCNVWGQCGITDEFCVDTSTGAPGSAEKGTNGCISNCGTELVRGNAPEVFRSIAYFEGYSLGSRNCLYQDAIQIDGSKYTHLHFAFGILTDDYQVKFQDAVTEYEFQNFMKISGPKKILSFGGWDFSAQPSTYNIFRQGVKAANRLTMATNIANFIKENNLDGVDIDWEYPGAPDIPGIPPDDPDSGDNYLAFLVILKNLLPGKSVSIAAASSYFYLKNFPIAKISKVVDYIIYMTYDLHGQWDAMNPNSQIGCPSGMCLRSQVNLTETISSLVMITKAGVPSNQVVVGVTSYGRSFAMADPSCHGPECFYTGGPYDSQATPGKCTATGGYISDAEINEILEGSTTNGLLKRDGRVNQHYVDQTSNSDILVYDNTQWVAYMSPATKASRKSLYKGLNMGGTTDWATDLQQYNDPPTRGGVLVENWAAWKTAIKNNEDPWQVGDRTGNWTELHCTDQAVVDKRTLSPSERWNRIDAPHAWADAINVWKTIDKGTQMAFTASISDTLDGPESVNCGTLKSTSNCGETKQCKEFDNNGAGPAGYLIWNSLVYVHELYQSYHNALFQAAASEITNALDDFENKFAPIPEPADNTWLLLLIDLITLGTASAAAPFFNSVLSKLPYFIAKGSTLDNVKDTTMTIISQSTTIAKDLLSDPDPDDWTPEKQNEFTNYMGQSIAGWGAVVEKSLSTLFDGSDASIEMLTDLISDGRFVEGSSISMALPPSDAGELPKDTMTALQKSISKSFFAFAIPSIWTVSGRYPFVIDAGYSCDHADDMGDYLEADTMKVAKACYRNKRYYLAAPEGQPWECVEGSSLDNPFSALPGVDSMGQGSFGNVTVEDIIIGSVRTYLQNGETNGGGAADPADEGTLEDLYNDDITTPGMIRLPVCSAETAYRAWDHGDTPDTDAPNYPCVIYPAPDYCGSSTFVDQTSDASPTVSDCMQIVKNIAKTDGKWEVENAIGSQHQLVQYGTCAFGVQGKGKHGNIDFHIGAQDIVDIISDSVRQFGGSGKVGSKGKMSCKGTVKGQTVEWGLYHD
ncbi:killer toxin subunits alpha/beta [Aspergillus lentulus]|uniref:chitinase n=1 Tax=Aspergillus lentulus TaxID=293939 RepID=A0ABQ1AED2_ASPLE|nr:killer toxin subunits alpha/beta [Aspergillus lentulus]